MDTISIGLDIGSSAVRAAETVAGKGRPTLRRYAQIGLPKGAVVDGEVVNPGVVTDALRRLWAEGGFSSRKVVLGVSGHRVIVRQADVPALDDEDLRSALRFDAQELIPIPMEEASFDFQVLERGSGTDEDGRRMSRILIVAAHKDLLRSHLGAIKGAGLDAVAVDAAPLALMRVVPVPPPGAPGHDGVEALVAIGAELTTVAVRRNGVPAFIRSLAVGGSKLTLGIAGALHVEPAVAERFKRATISGDSPQLAQARRTVSAELRDLGEEVRATIDFFMAQSDGSTVERLLVTGGASQTSGLVEALAGGLAVQIQRIDPFSALSLDDLGLDEAGMRRARATAATAVGLSLWPLEAPGSRLSVLPEEVTAARQARRRVSIAAAGVAGLAGVLVLAAGVQVLAVHQARDQVLSEQAHVAVLQAQVNKLQKETAVHGQVIARANMVITALKGDIDWVSVINQLAAVTPPGLSLTSLTGTRTNAGTAGAPPAGSATASGPTVGTLTFSVSGPGGLPAVAAWLDGLKKDPMLTGTWVSGISVTSNGGTVTFSSTTDMTPKAESNRAQAVKK